MPPIRRIYQCGINRYPDSPLRGCVNDILLFNKIVKQYYGFKQIKIHTDKEATKKEMMQGLRWVVDNVPPNSYLMVQYSGHGSQVRVTDKTANSETDGYDEILIPYDHDWDWPLRDNELGEIFKRIKPTVKVLFLADCCFSGTLLREFSDNPGEVRNRYLEPPPSRMLYNSEEILDDDLNYLTSRTENGQGTRTVRKPFLVDTNKQGNVILISGCSDRQTSADARFGNHFHGALTFYLAQTLAEANWNITYRELVTIVNNKLDKENYEQDPQLECKAELMDELFLGGLQK
jgi:metacaspase-1